MGIDWSKEEHLGMKDLVSSDNKQTSPEILSGIASDGAKKTHDQTVKGAFNNLLSFYKNMDYGDLSNVSKGSEFQKLYGCDTCPKFYNGSCHYGPTPNSQQTEYGGCTERYAYYLSYINLMKTDALAIVNEHLVQLKVIASDLLKQNLAKQFYSRELIAIHKLITDLELKLVDMYADVQRPVEQATFNQVRKYILDKASNIKRIEVTETETIHGTNRNNNPGNETENKPEVSSLG